ncbi:MAG: AAA family ATPase [Candidatus Spyradocola sp.]
MKTLAIERQFGSGGREIGRLVARTANLPYYDSELLRSAARAKGLPIDELLACDEQRTGSLLYDIVAFTDAAQFQGNRTVYELFDGVAHTVQQLHRSGPAVFVGRCTTDILREEKNVLRVFVYASDPADRVRRVMRTECVSEHAALRLMDKKDRQRRNYFKYWTRKEWLDRNNYDLELNTSALPPEACAKILLAAMDA